MIKEEWLKKRAENICQGETLIQELKHIEDAFVANNYPRGLVRKTLRKRKRMTQEEHTDEERILCLPYIKGVSEILQRISRPLNVKVVHKAPTTLRSLLTKVKTPIPQNQLTGVVYQISCECGDAYIGETSKTLDERQKEHQRAVRRFDNNSVATHVRDTGHNIAWKDAKVILKERYKTRRRVKEAIKIKTTTCFNMDQGISLDPIWNDLMN